MSDKIIHHYFVDESGDTILFNRRGTPVRFGEDGASKFFMLGVAHLHNPDDAAKKLDVLRQDFLRDPELQLVPSLKKTATAFHAKNDFHSVRREMMRLIESLEVEAYIAIRRKAVLINQAKLLFKETGNKLTGRMIYGDLVRLLFQRLLHRSDENHIVFAERGKTFTNLSLQESINQAQRDYIEAHGESMHNNHIILCGWPGEHAGLQVADYLLWVIQRLYVREQDYYFNKLASKFKLIIDVDDTRDKLGGEYYDESNPLDLGKIKSIG